MANVCAMHWNRRRFLAANALVAGAGTITGALWLRKSPSWAARFLRERVKETRRAALPAPLKPQTETWDANRITVTWIGHATVLINFYGVNILTDPVFSLRVGPNLQIGVLGPKRFIVPALTAKEIPHIDVLVLSHAHWDHLDLPSLQRIEPPALTVTASATADLLESTPMRQAKELRWGEGTTYRGPQGELRIEAFEVKHWGARWRKDTHRGYNGYLLSRAGKSLVFGGDTAYTPSFAGLKSRGPHELAIMPIAAYRPWIRNHCTPEEAVRMADEAGARCILPVHHSTFKLSEEPLAEPMERLQAALQREPERLALKSVGETCVLG